jgi:23S rRNA pseudouridine1911/1915/1917 synthase
VAGVPDRDRDVVDEPIGAHPTQREKKAIRREDASARPAITVFEVLERFSGYSLIRALPKTGRTHQIRIHLAHIGCPVLCDRLYGGRAKISELELMPRDKIGQDDRPEEDKPLLDRQALHAHRLSITSPLSGERMRFEAALPPDMENTLAVLRKWRHIK